MRMHPWGSNGRVADIYSAILLNSTPSLHYFADALLYVYNITSLFVLGHIHYVSINFFAIVILLRIKCQNCFLHVHSQSYMFFYQDAQQKELIASPNIMKFNINYFEAVLITSFWNLTITLNRRCTLKFWFQSSQNKPFSHLVRYPVR